MTEKTKSKEMKKATLEERVEALEKALPEIAKSTKDILEAVKKQKEDGGKKDDDKGDDSEGESEKTKEAVAGAEGTVAAPPEPEGIDVKLPKAVNEDKDSAPSEPGKDKVDILQKEVTDLKKSV